MQQHVHAELIGGPQDGRSFILPAPGAQPPVGEFTFGTDGAASRVHYERYDRRADGVWRYQFAGEQAA
ncbi:hypothetical protein IQ251_19260 [Saccharopolyspora sp. HNM0983]|uniref:Uncharacterized protein n=1 Tax=Saccharopolyspora montiporae TaxID=2781240 RepID=A0A929BFH3_9PSEU|nr:hypothetical protein [Saccharopolyspora sp. HNM0983]MBE9376593.1 hypothetical protein [Saccharopolyspora sp. HNM0983]